MIAIPIPAGGGVNKIRTTTGLGLTAALLALVWFGLRPSPTPAPAAEPPPIRAAGKPAQPAVVGAVGCSGVACHGRPVEGLVPASGWSTADKDEDRGRWRSSYTVWRSYDPHAGAFDVLGNDLSKQIEARLATPGGASRDARSDVRCLACHANPALANDPQSREYLAEGVSCEACHGNAGAWIGEHAGWSAAPGHGDKYRPTGMTKLSDPAVRAEMCAACHVGGPGRDVNHDLIAAGHPRLNFDYATYLRALPAHWAEKDRDVSPPALRPATDEFRHWLVGRAAATAAGYRLLADRAKRGPWPELAAVDCYACHHGLTDRQQSRLGQRPGALVWTEPPLVAQLGGPEWGYLLAALNRPLDVEHLQTQAARAADHWRKLSERWTTDPLRPANVATMLSRVKPRRWDEACHLYYAVLALDRAQVPNPQRPDSADLAQVRAILRLPRAVEGTRLNSPAELPTDELSRLFGNLLRARAGRE
jgi:Cytochrome c554 and c-prime